MNKNNIIILIFVSLLFFSACSFLAVDDEIMDIAKKGHYTDCDSLDTSENKNRIDKCYAEVGKRQNDPDACAAINDKQSNYKTGCYQEVAVNLHDETLCKYVNAQVNQRDCYTEIGVYKKNPHLCMNLEGVNAQLCYKEYAYKAQDIDACLSIPHNEKTRDDCMMLFIDNAKDETFCDKFDLDTSRDDCYLKIAPQINGNLLCAKISNDYKREQCHIKMAIQLKSIDECNRMKNIDSKEWNTCISQVAVVKLDAEICSVIQDDANKESCLKQVNNAKIQANASNT
jgi:hypothetical protein